MLEEEGNKTLVEAAREVFIEMDGNDGGKDAK